MLRAGRSAGFVSWVPQSETSTGCLPPVPAPTPVRVHTAEPTRRSRDSTRPELRGAGAFEPARSFLVRVFVERERRARRSLDVRAAVAVALRYRPRVLAGHGVIADVALRATDFDRVELAIDVGDRERAAQQTVHPVVEAADRRVDLERLVPIDQSLNLASGRVHRRDRLIVER